MIRGLALLALLLAGCGAQPRQINPGAAVPIYVAPQSVVQAEYHRRGGARMLPPLQVRAFYDALAVELWLTGTPAQADVLALYTHELLIHFVLHQGGDPREAAARLQGRGFDVLALDAPAETRAQAAAFQAAEGAR